MSDKELAAVVLLQRAVLDELKAVEAQRRDEMAAQMRPGDAIVAHIDGDMPLGRVRMDKPRVSARVTDEAAFLAWCRVHAPEQVQTVEMVRPAYREAVLRAKGALPERIDEATGEVLPEARPDGIGLHTASAGVLVVTPSTDARILARVVVAEQSNLLGTQDLPAALTAQGDPS